MPNTQRSNQWWDKVLDLGQFVYVTKDPEKLGWIVTDIVTMLHHANIPYPNVDILEAAGRFGDPVAVDNVLDNLHAWGCEHRINFCL